MNENLKSVVEAYAFGPVLYANTGGRIDIVMKISDVELIHKIIYENVKGLSPEIKICKWRCSICDDDYEVCEHQYGKIYNRKTCKALPDDTEPLSVGIVYKPKDERCRIEDLLLIVSESGYKKYIWYGFKPNRISKRFNHLQKAYEKGLISADSLHSFSKHFSDDLISVATYPIY